MVWGMALPGSFGEFFPDGDFVGWTEALSEYFDTKMPAQQKAMFERPNHSSYARYVAEKFITEPGLKRPGFPPFGPIETHEVPRQFETVKKYLSLGSLIELSDQILAVDAALKDVIESFEPAVHRFSPIEIVMPRKVVYPKPYFVMVVGQYLDSFLPEQSASASWSASIEGYCLFEEEKKLMAGLAMSGQAFGNAHLWRERRMVNPLVCFSDRLVAEITRLGLRLPKLCLLREV